MKKRTALAAIAASTFAIGAYAEQGDKEIPNVAEAQTQLSARAIVNDLGIDSGTYELTPTSNGSPETWEGVLAG
ncbi:hypothetical protein L8V01_08660 [Corynebacterium sp. c8Ua_181]|uniref:Uncharacterized protein n=1 Tax=Corynebacterium curieae TaxID=2913500 RepID=A0A9X3MAZ8_9CORY|nr:hypothetical protein [Corynebacterium curieae]MCZ9307542.1 hypothetical protein [Corynebacterium curieae]MDV2424234.1 hypothetical protein [Corynebacterium curieae]